MAPFLDAPSSPSPTPPAVAHSKHAVSEPTPNGETRNRNVDVAVVGMACRLPGDNNTVEQFWQSILDKKVAIGDLPADRWEAYYRRDPRNPKILNETTKRGYFIPNINDFDNTFFGISPKEAALMDPQQRIALEVTWEALEHAGIPPQSLAGSNTACYMGVNSDDFGKLVLEDLTNIEAWLGIGTAYCGVPNRVSYHLDLKGPSTAVDAACASSLVAVHHGRVSLMTGETNLAIVGGVQALCNPGMSRVLDLAGATAKDGECRSFDDSAHGYGRGEGAVVIILKRLDDALHDDDRILAVMKGSAVGQDGKTNGIMAPNGDAQEAVARTALGGIDPESIQYVEAHATSTAVGDPVEIGAMATLYGRSTSDPCYIGSAKSNVGHLEAGAGAVGFAKAVMAIRDGVIPPQANLEVLNKKIDWSTAGIKVALEPTAWPSRDTRRAAVSSYGYGGTVSHAVVEEAPSVEHETPVEGGDTPTLVLLSAPQEKRLASSAESLATWFRNEGAGSSIVEVAATLAARRGHHTHRASFVAQSQEQVLEMLELISQGSTNPQIITGRTMSQNAGIIWAFSGHGAQWQDMGKELIQSDSVFRDTIERLDVIIKEEAGFSAISALETGDFDKTDKIQILTYAMQIGLATTLQSRGLHPSAIIGHSVGEIAAAVVAGALTAPEGALVVCKRAVLYRQVMGQGAMALVSLPFQETAALLEGSIDVNAAIDASPSSCVVSGTVIAVDEFAKLCNAQKVQIRRVKSDVAFHTPLLKCLAEPLAKALSFLQPKQPNTPLYSTALPNARKDILRDASYWVRNMIQPVLLTNAVQSALQDGFRLFMEVSAHPIISHSINETIMEADIEDFAVVPTLLRAKPASQCLLRAISTIWLRGGTVDWRSFFSETRWNPKVPFTQWQHKEFRKPIETGSPSAAIEHDADTHTLLGQKISIAGEEKVIFTSKLSNDNKPFPGSHPLHGTEIVPAAVLLNTFLEATQGSQLEDVHLRVPVAISAPRDLQVIAQPDSIRLASRLIQTKEGSGQEDAAWLTHTTAKMSSVDRSYGEDLNLEELKGRVATVRPSTFTVDYLAGVGVPLMGFPWAVVKHAGNEKEMLVFVDVCPDTKDGAAFPWHAESWAPIFDAATSIGSTLFFKEPRLRMPARVRSVAIRPGATPPKMAYIFVEASKEKDVEVASDVTITDAEGKALAKFTCMQFAEIEGTPGTSPDGLAYQVSWVPAKIVELPLNLEHVVLVGEKRDVLMDSYSEQLTSRRISHTATFVENFASSQMSSWKSASSAIIYMPPKAQSVVDIAAVANKACQELLHITKVVLNECIQARIHVITCDALSSVDQLSLSQSSLVGLSRIIASEHPQVWGGLIDVDSTVLPYQCLKYVSGEDVIKLEDSVAKVARLRPIPRAKSSARHGFQPRPEGTYLISGGLGALGLEVASHLVQGGARRIVLLSRRSLPPRNTWQNLEGEMLKVTRHIMTLEDAGATVLSFPIDLTAEEADLRLQATLDALGLPPVAGVIHAAGLVEDQLVLSTTPDAFARVMAPKVAGALALHRAYPPNTVDFFILMSSCGQLFGFPGQASYASGNALLDSLAEHRRRLGDNAVAFQWTSWRGVGGMGDNEFVEAELENRGITSISRAEAFLAGDEVSKHGLSHAVVLRSRMLDVGEDLPHRILENIVVRRQPETGMVESHQAKVAGAASPGSAGGIPAPGPERSAYLEKEISSCVATVLQFNGPEEVDTKAALSDMGMDSVMTAAFRRKLQQTLKVKVPPTLVWGHPTVSHLVKWASEQLE